MKVLSGFGLALLLSTGLFAQHRGGFVNPQPFLTGSFGNVVFPGGTAAMPGIHRTFGNVVFPGGSGPRLVVPGSVTDPTFLSRPGGPRPGLRGQDGQFSRRRNGNMVAFPVAYPVFADGFYDNPYLGDGVAGPQGQQPPQNVVVVYPPVQQSTTMPNPNEGIASGFAPAAPAAAEDTAPEPDHYLIAFKDKTIYAALAFWVNGDTLHYFTAGNTHNQVSLSLVDKELTQRLNRESGVDLRLP